MIVRTTHGRTTIPMPARLHQLLRAARLRLPDRKRSGSHCGLCGDDGAGVRKALCLSDQESASAARPALAAVPLLAGWRVLDSCGEAGAVPPVSVLAGVGG